MKIVVFGLTVTSSWSNGHATLWRGLLRALARSGCVITFFEHDVPWYAAHRDLHDIEGASIILYDEWRDAEAIARAQVASADVAIVTSYCPDGPEAVRMIFDLGGRSVFYDLDAPVTLARVAAGDPAPYLPPEGLGGFDLVLSYTGGRALDELKQTLGARATRALYGHVDPDHHRPAAAQERFRADLSYLGTYAADRQSLLEQFFLQVAERLAGQRFLIGGAVYPEDFPWRENIWFAGHVAPPDHCAFFSSCRLMLNISRSDMAAFGWCPSGRLFEAAACGAPIISDVWAGLDSFYEPGQEILLAQRSEDVVEALLNADLQRIAAAARARTLDEHTSAHRARELLRILDEAL